MTLNNTNPSPIKYMGPRWIKTSEILQRVSLRPERQSISVEMEQEDIEFMEKENKIDLSPLTKIIKKLDEISPNRIHNPDFLSWKSLYRYQPKRILPVGFITDSLHILSINCPSLINISNLDLVPSSDTKTRRILKKMRTKNSKVGGKLDPNKNGRLDTNQIVEIQFWKDIVKNTNFRYLYSVPTVKFLNELMICHEISQYYLTIFVDQLGLGGLEFVSDKSLDEDFSNKKEEDNGQLTQLLRSSYLISLFDVFGEVKLKNRTPSIDQKYLDLIEKNKYRFSRSVSLTDLKNPIH